MREQFNQLVTGKDNETWDVGRVGFILGLFVFLGNSMFSVYSSGVFNAQDFGIGFAGLAGGVGALLKLKENTEPKGE